VPTIALVSDDPSPAEEPQPPEILAHEPGAAEDPGDEARDRLISWRPSYSVALGLAYGSLFAIVVVGICLVALLPHVSAVQQYGPNIVADFVGLLIALTFVERLLKWQRLRQEAPLRTVALHRSWLRLNRMTHMLLFSCKAAAIEGSPAPTELEALMAGWRVEARHLDFRKSAGAQSGNRPWYPSDRCYQREPGHRPPDQSLRDPVHRRSNS
jgi:hypothetical protein